MNHVLPDLVEETLDREERIAAAIEALRHPLQRPYTQRAQELEAALREHGLGIVRL